MNKFDANDLRNRVAMAQENVKTAKILDDDQTPGFATLALAVGQLADAVEVLVDVLYQADRSARIANDTASMLANGIQPD